MDWIELAEHRDGCRPFFNLVIKIRVPQNAG
jgi:hypothetical protein